MFDLSNNLHILFIVVMAVLFVVLAINMVALCVSKKYTRRFVDVLLSMFLWILLFILIIAVALIVIIAYVTIPNIKISILSLVFSLSSEQLSLILGSSISVTVSFTGEVYEILELISAQALIAACLLLTFIGLILHGNKCKGKKWFIKREKAESEKSAQLNGLDDVEIDGKQAGDELLNQLSDVDMNDNQSVYFSQTSSSIANESGESASSGMGSECGDESNLNAQTVESNVLDLQSDKNETIGQMATKFDKEEVDLSTGIADEDMLPQFDEVPSSEDYFNDKFILEEQEEYLADVDDEIEQVNEQEESLSSSYFNDNFMLDEQDELADDMMYDENEDAVLAEEQAAPVEEQAAPVEEQVTSVNEPKIVLVKKVAINKPRAAADKKPRTRKSSGAPRTSRRVVKGRDNAAKMFADYLNSKDEQSKEELTNSMEHINLK